MNRTRFTLLTILGLAAVLLLPSSASAGVALSPIQLNDAERFAILAGSDAVTAAGPAGTIVAGDVGVFPGTSITGFPPAMVIGEIHQTDTVAQMGQASLDAALVAADAIPCPIANDLTGLDLSGRTLTPGVYCFSSTASFTGPLPLILDLQGDPDAFFLFKIGSSITTGSGTSVQLMNSGGAICPRNVFWRTIASATLGSGSTFLGNILAGASVGLDPSAQLRGRALAKVAVTLSGTNLVTRCDGGIIACPTITVNPPTLPGGTVGVPYNQIVTASGSPGPFNFSLAPGTFLPPGLVLSPTGTISGTPTTEGPPVNFTIIARDLLTTCTGSQTYAIQIGTFFTGTPAGGSTLDVVGLAVLMILLVGAGLFVMNKLSL